MSWASRIQQFRKLEDKILNKTVGLEDVLKEDLLLNGLGQQLMNLSNLMVSNLTQIFDISIGKVPLPVGVDSRTCLMVLTSKNDRIYRELSSKPDFINYLVSSFSPEIDLSYFFRILIYIIEITDGKSWFFIKQPLEFFTKLLDMISNSYVYNFLYSYFSKAKESLILWLCNIQADQLFLKMLTHEESVIIKSLELIKLLLVSNEQNSFIKQFLKFETFKFIFEQAIEAPTIDISDSCFRILIIMSNNSSELKGNNTCSFDEIMDFVESKSIQLCEHIMRDHVFTPDKYRAALLVKDIIDSKSEQDQCIFDLIEFLFKDFFDYPTNSFLHLALLQLFKSLSVSTDQLNHFVAANNVKEKIMYEFSLRSSSLASYWGILIELSDVLDSKLISNEDELWNDFIKSVVDVSKSKWIQDYGGAHHKDEIEENNSIAYLCQNYNSCDALTDIIGKIIAEEEEEEGEEEEEEEETEILMDINSSDDYEDQ